MKHWIGKIEGVEIAVGVMEFAYMGGSMGSVVGEKIVKLIVNQSGTISDSRFFY